MRVPSPHRLGLAVFEARTNTVSYCSQDFWGAPDLEWTLQAFFQQVAKPSVILTRWAAACCPVWRLS